jgi:D-sedoheptulose 7-phosphate isomerase
MKTFLEEYFGSIRSCFDKIPHENVEGILHVLLEAYTRQATVFIAGNGGSASTASHFACDLAKTTLGPEPMKKQKRFKTVSLADNIALLTAWANDEGYEHVFSEQLKNLARKGDVLVVISASGNSPNIIKALETARTLGLHTIGLLGFGGGKAAGLVDESIVIESHDYGHVEGVHSVIGHMMTSRLRKLILELNDVSDGE